MSALYKGGKQIAWIVDENITIELAVYLINNGFTWGIW